MTAIQLCIAGRVQGVFFRSETLKKARELGITGWVRNCSDGSVEIHAEGSAKKLNELEKWCHTGPPAARVESVEVENTFEEGLSDFDIRD